MTDYSAVFVLTALKPFHDTSVVVPELQRRLLWHSPRNIRVTMVDISASSRCQLYYAESADVEDNLSVRCRFAEPFDWKADKRNAYVLLRHQNRKVRDSSHRKAVYTPKGVFLHAASLPQPFGHWGRFLTAASRRSLGSVSVPVRRVALSRPLSVVALVGRYPTN